MRSPVPRVPLFEVRAEVDKVTDVRGFDRTVEIFLAKAEQAGDFEILQERIWRWLEVAMIGQNQREVIDTPYADRQAVIDRLTAAWVAKHPLHTNFQLDEAADVPAADIEVKPEFDGPMRGFLCPDDDEEPPKQGVTVGA